MVIDFESRTNQKLEFARLSLNEITSRPELASVDDFERSHEEDFLFHLIGVKDSFLQEINVTYELDVPIRDVKEAILQSELERRGLVSKELAEIIELKMNKASWLAIAIELRNKGSHRFHLTRLYDECEQSKSKGKVFLLNPFNEEEKMEIDVIQFLTQCLDNMKFLLQQLRTTLPKC